MTKSIYKMVQLENNWDGIPNHFDCFFIAGGSDFRAYEILRKAERQKIKIDNILFFDFDERKRVKKRNYKNAYNAYKGLKFTINEIPCSIKDPSTCIKSLKKYNINLSKYMNLAIDVTCFTKPYFFLILKHLHAVNNVSSVTVFYTEPKSYIFTEGLYNTYRSSLGPLTPLEIPGYTGSDIGGQERLLVILLGFDGDLAKEISEDVAPEHTIVVNGFPGYALKFKDISLICNEKLINSQVQSVRYARANNPFELYNLLEKLKESHGDSFINIAPLGTKPMAIGACMFAIHNPKVRIIYPIPKDYTNVTTDSCWNSWAYNIPLILSN